MTGPAHVLIVDDDEDLREVTSTLLRSCGYSTATAADGGAALRALTADPGVQLIVLDLQMPVMDGRTFLSHKARGPHAAIPVIVFTASPLIGLTLLPDVIAVVAKESGIEGLLAKIPANGGFHARDESGA